MGCWLYTQNASSYSSSRNSQRHWPSVGLQLYHVYFLAYIRCRVNAAPPFPGLRRFPDGRDFAQWTGDDSKALMKVHSQSWYLKYHIDSSQVYLAAIVGYVPPDIIKAMSSFLDFCYIARRNSLSSSNLSEMDDLLTCFHHYRTSFINSGVREAISLPCQHGLTHYVPGIRLFGSPNGLCSSITESKHIKSKELSWST